MFPESDVWTLSSRPTTGSHASSSPQVSSDHAKLELGGVVAPLLFTFKELQKLTDGFDRSRQIGEGGFGKVYWARVRDQDVAIKRLEKDAAMSAKQVQSWKIRTCHVAAGFQPIGRIKTATACIIVLHLCFRCQCLKRDFVRFTKVLDSTPGTADVPPCFNT